MKEKPPPRRLAAMPLAALLVASAAGAPGPKAAATRPGKSELVLREGRSREITAPWPIARASVTAPKVADVRVLTERAVLVQGKGAGRTDVLLWSAEERRKRIDVVVRGAEQLTEAALQRLFPDSDLSLSRAGGTLVVRGKLPRAGAASDLGALLDATGEKHVNMTSLAGPQQVLLRVRVAEVDRTALRSLGVNLLHAGEELVGAQTVGGLASVALTPLGRGGGASAGSSGAVTVLGALPDADLQLFLRALRENRYLRLLAEPNLVALSGEEASFLAGGEFPVPVPQDSGGGGDSITVEFRKFGVRLRFRPTVLGEGRIRLDLTTEVSELSDTGGVQVQGFQIPSILTRRAATTLELESGESFAIAGLLSQDTVSTASRLPVLGELPVLGPLFRSTRYKRNETELLILVQAELVAPDARPIQKRTFPGELHEPPDDWELFMEGRIEGRDPARVMPPPPRTLERRGLGDLRGPGAWQQHGEGGG